MLARKTTGAVRQLESLGGKIVGGLGSILDVSPFNEFGRRVLTVRGPKGPVHIVQGTEEELTVLRAQ